MSLIIYCAACGGPILLSVAAPRHCPRCGIPLNIDGRQMLLEQHGTPSIEDAAKSATREKPMPKTPGMSESMKALIVLVWSAVVIQILLLLSYLIK